MWTESVRLPVFFFFFKCNQWAETIRGRNQGHLSLAAIATILNYKVSKFFTYAQDCTQLQKLQFLAEVVNAENNRISQS